VRPARVPALRDHVEGAVTASTPTTPDPQEDTMADEQSPYVVHVAGPDDVHDASTWLDAVRIAHDVNATVLLLAERDVDNPNPEWSPRIWATPYTREAYDHG
jgi:hypothetical protein